MNNINIGEIIENFNERNKANFYKVSAILRYINLESLKFLKENGIYLSKPSQLKLTVIDIETLKERLEYAKNNNMMDMIFQNPLTLLDKNLFQTQKLEPESNDVPALEPIEIKSITPEKNNSINDILINNEQAISLNEDTFQRYQVLSDCANHIIETVNTKSLTKESSVYDNLVKLITNNVASDYDVLYNALTFNKSYQENILNSIKNAITLELEIVKKANNEERGI